MNLLKKREFILFFAIFVLGIIAIFFDEQISLFLYSLRNNFLDSIFGATGIIQFSGIVFGILILIFAVIFFLKKEKMKWILRIVSSFVFTNLLVFLIKGITARPRPYLAFDLENPPFSALGDSFPSAHAATVFAMLPFFEKEYPKLKYVWIAFAVIVCFIRIYFPVHYLSDILIGAFIGYAIGFLLSNYKFKKNKKPKNPQILKKKLKKKKHNKKTVKTE
jgi:undecaprenyl-diphosphatase